MKAADIEPLIDSGTEVAVDTGISRHYLGDSSAMVQRATVLEVRVERDTSTHYYPGSRRRSTVRDGVRVQIERDPGHWVEQVVQSRDVLGLWDTHQAIVQEREQHDRERKTRRDAERQAFAAAIERLEGALGEPLPRSAYGVDGFMVDVRHQEIRADAAEPIEWLAERVGKVTEDLRDTLHEAKRAHYKHSTELQREVAELREQVDRLRNRLMDLGADE